MDPTQTTLPGAVAEVPAGLAAEILRQTGVAIALFGPDGAPASAGGDEADAALQRLAREAIARNEDRVEVAGGRLCGAWLIRLRSRTALVAAAALPAAGQESQDLGRRLLAAVAGAVRARVEAAAVRAESEEASESLLQTFEEVSLLHHLGEVLRVNRSEDELLEYVCGELRDTVDAAATVAYLPGADGGAGRTIVAGRLPFPAADLPAIVRRLLEGSGSEAFVLINNHCQDDPVLSAAAPGLERVVLVPLPVCDGVWGALAAVNRQGEEFGSPDAKLVRSTSSACAIFIENRRLYRELQEMMLDLMRALVSSIDAKDPYTCGHSERVAMTCRKIAVRLGLRDEEVEHVYLAGLLHDIGKIGTPEAILRKEGRLEPEERLIMIQHPSVGSHILAGIRKLEVIREAVLSHHERIDGKGYPAGLAGDRIPMLARIVGMADAFDAMTSNRPYRPVMPLAQVKREIERNTGTQFDARVAEALLSLDLERLMEELAARVSHAAAR